MPGSIQSVERAAAILRTLAAASGPLRLGEVCAGLGLSKGTAHGILRTLTDVGFVAQDRDSGRYRLGPGLGDLQTAHLDGNELRARSMNWADPLAARSGEAVRVAVAAGESVQVVHYVFRPDPSVQQADVGTLLPSHATALGKVLLAHAAGPMPRRLTSYTARTVVDGRRLVVELAQARDVGFAVEFGEHQPDRAAIAAPILGSGGLPHGAVGIHGDLDRICDPAGLARPRLVELVRDCARAVGRELRTSRVGE